MKFICLLLFICSPAFAQKHIADGFDSTSAKYTIDNCVQAFDSTRIDSTKAGYQFWYINRSFVDGRTVKLSVVRPGEATHPPHVHPEDEFFFILDGQAEFILDQNVRKVGPNTCLYCPSGRMHGIRNCGSSELKYLVIKKYMN